jgi:putative transposase
VHSRGESIRKPAFSAGFPCSAEVVKGVRQKPRPPEMHRGNANRGKCEAPAREGEAPAELARHRRKHPAHGILSNGNNATIIFLTVCTKNRAKWLASPKVHKLLHSVWTKASAWLVGDYVIMPDHIHLFCAPNPMLEGEAPAEPIPFDNWVRYWKSMFTKRHKNPRHQWQIDHWGTRVRTWERYEDKWEYVRNNPVRHGLVATVDEWPCQGRVHDLTGN